MRHSLNLSRYLPSILPAALLFVLTNGLFWEVLWGGRRLFWGDLGLYFVPLLFVQKAALAGGHLALWNPRILCGTPLWGNPQAFPLYPSTLLLVFVPASQAVGIIAAFHVWLAAWGTFLFLRRRLLSQSAALFGAIAWGMGGAIVSKAQFPNMIQAATFLPFLLLAVERGTDKPGAKSAAFLAAVVGLALLAAHPQIFLMQFYVGLSWAVFRSRQADKPTRRKAAFFLCGGLILGLALASGQLLPTVEMVRASVRTQLTMGQANRFVLPAYAALTNFVAPNFYGNPATNTPYVGRGNFWEPCAYVGLAPFGLALWASVRLFARAHEVRFWAVISLLGVWLALGKDAGLWAAAFWILPGASKFHDAARWLYIGTWGVSCLGACGLDAFLRAQTAGIRRRLWAAGFISLTAWQVVAFGRTLNPTTPASVWQTVEQANPKKESGGRTFFADEHAAWAHWVSYRTYANLQNPDEVRRFLLSQTPNTNAFVGASDAGGYEPVRLRDTDILLSALKAHVAKRDFSRAQAMGVTRITRLDAKFAPQTQPVPGAWGRAAFFVRLNAPRPIPLQIWDSSPQKVTVFLPLQHPEGTVILADTNVPGWTTRTDSEPAQKPLTVGGTFRSVRVGKQAKQVVFEYAPASFRIGVFLSLVAVGILSALTFAQVGRRKNEPFPLVGKPRSR